jgi:hypothetical protein
MGPHGIVYNDFFGFDRFFVRGDLRPFGLAMPIRYALKAR